MAPGELRSVGRRITRSPRVAGTPSARTLPAPRVRSPRGLPIFRRVSPVVPSPFPRSPPTHGRETPLQLDARTCPCTPGLINVGEEWDLVQGLNKEFEASNSPERPEEEEVLPLEQLSSDWLVLEEVLTSLKLLVGGRKKMGTIEFGGPNFEVTKYDGRTNYLLWERQVKGVLRAIGLGKLLKDQPNDVENKDWREMQEQAVSIVMLYLQPNVIKYLADYADCSLLFEALRQKYHQVKLPNRLYTLMKLISFKMKENNSNIEDHINDFNDLVVELQNVGENLSDEQLAFHLLISLPSSYQALSWGLLHCDKKTITCNEVVSALLTGDLQQKLTTTFSRASSSGGPLNVNLGRSQQCTNDRDRSKSRKPFSSKGRSQERRLVVCWKCDKFGHVKRDCKG